MNSKSAAYHNPLEILRKLLQFKTINPPGAERECVMYIRGMLEEAGIESVLVAKDEGRPNLIARISGRGDAPPLLLYGHVDVVTIDGQVWDHDPFAAEIADGFVWGRGTLDMKGPLTMLIAAFLRAHAEGLSLPGDVILCVAVDEEAGGDFGAKYLVQEHPELFEGVRFALGEFGGFNLPISGRQFYPIMVGEKQTVHLRATLRGPAGHGSFSHKRY